MVEAEVSIQIAVARTRISEAEESLNEALAAIQSAPRAEKTTVSAAVELAFEQLRSARAILAALEISEPDDDAGGP